MAVEGLEAGINFISMPFGEQTGGVTVISSSGVSGVARRFWLSQRTERRQSVRGLDVLAPGQRNRMQYQRVHLRCSSSHLECGLRSNTVKLTGTRTMKVIMHG